MHYYDLLRAIAALLVTLGLLAGFAYLARRYGWNNGSFNLADFISGVKGKVPEKRIKIIEQTFLDAKGSRIMIIAIDDEEHLLMVAPNGAKILKDLPKTKIHKSANVEEVQK